MLVSAGVPARRGPSADVADEYCQLTDVRTAFCFPRAPLGPINPMRNAYRTSAVSTAGASDLSDDVYKKERAAMRKMSRSACEWTEACVFFSTSRMSSKKVGTACERYYILQHW